MSKSNWFRTALILIALQVCVLPCALAAPGALDPSFNASGVALFNGRAYANDVGKSVALQPDGKIVVVGQVDNGTDKDILVTRYNSDGTLDTTFGSGGSVTYDGGYNDVGNAVAIQADGGIVVGGQIYNGAYDDVVVLRYLSNGAEDESFGPGGATFYRGGWQTSQGCNALAIQADGRIIAAGYIRDLMGNEDVLLLRLKTDGRLDDNFGFEGVTVYDSFSSESAAAVIVQPDGKIVVAGTVNAGASYDVLLLRYNSDGTSLDAAFGGNGSGVVRYGGGLSDEYGTALALGTNGKLVVAGYLHNGTDTDMLVLSYDSDGILDGSFGAGGVKTFDSGRADYARAVVVQGDGKVVVCGSKHNGSDDDVAILRYNADGSGDGAFGTAGLLTYNSGHGDHVYALALQSDGMIVGAGSVENGSAYDQVVMRFTSGGSLDVAFDGDGVAVMDTTFPTQDYAYGMVVQPDGKVVIAGERKGDVLLLRYTAQGTLDASFGSGGVVTYDSGGNDAAYGVAVQPDGKIVVSGSTMGQLNHDLLILRYNGDGTLDAGFGTAGVASYEAGGDDIGFAVALQPDGKILVAGAGGNMFGSMVLLVRFNANGTPDTGFGTAGIATFDSGGFDNTGYALTVLPDGKISVGGYSLGRLLLLQYLSDGTLDPSFGTDGVVRPDNGRTEYGTFAAVGPDGKAVVTGYAFNDNTNRYDVVVARFDSSGTPDAAFGAGGVVTYGGALDYYPFGVVVQPDRKTLITGYTRDQNNMDRLFVLRLDASGSPDAGFGSNGLFTYSGGSYDYGYAMALQEDGRILVTGSSVQQEDYIVTLRLEGGPFPLAVSKNGPGTVTSDDGAITCGNDCSESYSTIRQVTLTGTAAAGFALSSWNGCDTTSGNQCTVTTLQARIVTANFIETSGPVLSVATPADGLLTRNATVTVAGTASDSSGLQALTVNGTTVAVSGDGSYSHLLSLTPGQNTITVIARDVNGNLTTVVRTVTSDSLPPSLSVSTPSADLVTNQQSFVIGGTTSDLLGAVTVTVTANGQTHSPVLTNGTYQQQLTFADEGIYPVVVTATDEAGNTATVQRSISYVRWGDVDGISGLTVEDAMLALRYQVGLVPLAPLETARCDVAPTVGGIPQPNGTVDIADVLVILRKVVGLGW